MAVQGLEIKEAVTAQGTPYNIKRQRRRSLFVITITTTAAVERRILFKSTITILFIVIITVTASTIPLAKKKSFDLLTQT